MNHGPLIFLGAFAALACSFFGLIIEPQLQFGAAQPTNSISPGELYPQARSGQAQQGLQVYRSLGCATCHSQQVGQTGTIFDLVLAKAGTNQAEVVKALAEVKPGLTEVEANRLLARMPAPVLESVDRTTAETAKAKLQIGGAQPEVIVVPTGPDIARGWGKRRSVAADFLFDQPVMLGSQRIGPDLQNFGMRMPAVDLQLVHLYNPRITVKGSVMPPYPFLFEKRKINGPPSPEALKLTGEFAPETGYEIVPTDEARALVAYLRSLEASAALFETPMTAPPAPAAPAPTNAPVAHVSTTALK
jgi:cbb3-type cytochrome oxidase cytochrome c subunit